jgi:hypothetical protein
MNDDFYSSFSPNDLSYIIGKIFIEFFMVKEYGICLFNSANINDYRNRICGKLKEDIGPFKKGTNVSVLIDNYLISFYEFEGNEIIEENGISTIRKKITIIYSVIMCPESPIFKTVIFRPGDIISNCEKYNYIDTRNSIDLQYFIKPLNETQGKYEGYLHIDIGKCKRGDYCLFRKNGNYYCSFDVYHKGTLIDVISLFYPRPILIETNKDKL